jgi:hypothetical protein
MNPPQKKQLTTLGGVRNTTNHEKKTAFSIFCHFLPVSLVFFQNGFWENEDVF